MKPSEALALHRNEIRRLVQQSRARNPRVFGSVSRGRDTDQSDLDVLVDALPGTTLFDLGGLQVELQELLGVSVDLLTPGDLPPRSREQVLREAVPVWARAKWARLRIADYLSHMLESVRLAREYVDGMSQKDFLKDRRAQQAVVLNLMTVGEAAARVGNEHKEFAAANSDIPWSKMRGMRNRMAHGYFDIDLNIVWDTVHLSLKDLDHQLEKALSELTR